MNDAVAVLAILSCTQALSPGQQAIPDLAAGREAAVPFAPLKNPLIVRLPDDYTTDRAWPVVFHFHGTGGQPTIAIPLAYTKGKGFVIVGMEYITRDLPAATPDYLEREWTNLMAVRDALAKSVRIDPKRLFVGGFSQGGWFASEFMEVHGRELAGAYVLGAGKRPRNKREPKPFGAQRPVYLGAGQLDLNYPYTIHGIRHFAGLGGRVTFEDYLGLDHQVPSGGTGKTVAPGLFQWFRVEAMKANPDALGKEAANWVRSQTQRAAKDRNAFLQWLRLSRASRLPFFSWAGESDRRLVLDGIAGLEMTPAMQAEVAARTSYFQLIERELRGPGDGNHWQFTRDQAFRYAALWQKFSDTYHGKRCALELARLRDQCERANLWRFPDEATRQKSLAAAAANPLPEPPRAELIREFRMLGSALAEEAD